MLCIDTYAKRDRPFLYLLTNLFVHALLILVKVTAKEKKKMEEAAAAAEKAQRDAAESATRKEASSAAVAFAAQVKSFVIIRAYPRMVERAVE